MMEIIFHKCEFVGVDGGGAKAQRSACLEAMNGIEHTLKECIAANMLPANLLTRRALVLMRSYLSGADGKLALAPDSFDLEKKRERPCCHSS